MDFNPLYTPYASGLFGLTIPLILLAALWTVTLKGFALWYAAKAGQKWWFIALLIINTLGILEIIYLLFFRPKAPFEQVVEQKVKPMVEEKVKPVVDKVVDKVNESMTEKKSEPTPPASSSTTTPLV